ncbi:hypothetical protein BASA81_000535 [Batrachochytrium salamandrivorans]|nr:hypothetical protein BASA81_000535 [Batrachochytrium salamandrivorans]
MSKPPLSAKAQALLSQLKAHAVPGQRSQYVETLVENANKRKLASELAVERKLLREDPTNSAGVQVFVTKEYADQVAATERAWGEDSRGRFIHGERVDGSGGGGGRVHWRKEEDGPSAQDLANKLVQKRLDRRLGRLAPTESRLTPSVLADLTVRAKARLGYVCT